MPKAKVKHRIDRIQKPYTVDAPSDEAHKDETLPVVTECDYMINCILKKQTERIQHLHTDNKQLVEQLLNITNQYGEEETKNKSLKTRLCDAQHECKELKTKLNDQNDINKSIQDELQSLKTKHTSVETTYDQKVTQYNAILCEQAEQLQQKNNRISELETQIVRLTEQRKCDAVALERKTQNFANKMSEMQRKLCTCEATKFQLEKQISEMQRKAIEQANGVKLQLEQELNNALSLAEEKIRQQNQELQLQQESKIAEKSKLIEEMSAQLRRLEDELCQRHKELGETQSAFTELKESSNLQIKQLEVDHFSQQLAFSNLQREYETLQQHNRELSHGLASAKCSNEEKLSVCREEIEAQLQAARQGHVNEMEIISRQLKNAETERVTQKQQLEMLGERVIRLDAENAELRKTNDVTSHALSTQNVTFRSQLKTQAQQHQIALDKLQTKLNTELTAKLSTDKKRENNSELRSVGSATNTLQPPEVVKKRPKTATATPTTTATATVGDRMESPGKENTAPMNTIEFSDCDEEDFGFSQLILRLEDESRNGNP